MKRAALIINLGSPESPRVKDVKKYLGEFLMDPKVIDFKWLFRWFLVKGIILNVRPKKSAALYQGIWWEEGSPLIVLSQRLLKRVTSQTSKPVYLAMRYGAPAIQDTLERIRSEHPDLEQLYVVPLYPHYAMSSYETVMHRVEDLSQEIWPVMNVKFKAPWYDDPDYIQILSDSIAEKLPRDHHLLFSYHGIPLRHLLKTDPTGTCCHGKGETCDGNAEAHATCYRHQTLRTTEEVVRKLELRPGSYSTSYQSRLGRDPWLEPFTSERLEHFPEEGITKLAVVCPAFVSDCLETLEEINKEGEHTFSQAGGESFISIPCLNDRDDWSQLVAQWIDQSAD